MPTRTLAIAFVLVLGTVSTAARAGDVARHGPNGEGGSCPTAQADAAHKADEADPALPPGTRAAGKAAPRQVGAQGSGSRIQAPRWHSFLPGMFR